MNVADLSEWDIGLTNSLLFMDYYTSADVNFCTHVYLLCTDQFSEGVGDNHC